MPGRQRGKFQLPVEGLGGDRWFEFIHQIFLVSGTVLGSQNKPDKNPYALGVYIHSAGRIQIMSKTKPVVYKIVEVLWRKTK